jgi:hypothetical protein
MKFKKFYVSISVSLGATYTLKLEGDKWLYETDNDMMPMDVMVDGPVTVSAYHNNEVITEIDSHPAELAPSEHQLNRLHFYLKRYCQHWEADYAWMQYCDGTMWECMIEGEGFKLKSIGHVEAPGNFDTFLHKLTIFTGGKYFGPGID